MSFEKSEDCFVWSCNACHQEVAFPLHKFSAAEAELKNRGWSFLRLNEGDWLHHCPRCHMTKAQVLEIMKRSVH